MKISEIKEKNLGVEDLEIKKYLPFVHKKLITDNIVNGLVIEENGIKKISYPDKTLAIDFAIINNYTNIELREETASEDYDYLKETGLLDEIIDEINKGDKFELYELRQFIENSIEQKIRNSNTIEGILGIAMDKLIKLISDPDAIPAIISNLLSNPQVKTLIESIPNMPKLDTLINSNVVAKPKTKPKKNMLGFLKSVKGGK